MNRKEVNYGQTLMKQIKEYKDSLLTMLFTVVEVVLEIMIPLLMASLIDKGIEAGTCQMSQNMGL
ncbi:hypothetical protein [Faecalibacillus intestinalis]|uniref:hypothetical protein n=1 Tax=Faecalibacillus intestinalis TaxID=1982626 RepID=UPI003992EC23